MLKHRLLMSALLIPATIGLFVWDHHLGTCAPILFLLVTLLSIRGTWEFVTLARSKQLRPNLVLCCVASWTLLASMWLPHLPREVYGWDTRPWLWMLPINLEEDWDALIGALSVVVVVLLGNAVFRYQLRPEAGERPATHIETLAVELLAVVYLGLLLSLTSRLRWTGFESREGYFALGSLVVATKMGDVGAYTFGKLIGGAKMTPKLSPGKTWAGGCGHLVTAGLSSTAWLCWLGPMISEHWSRWHAVPAIIFGVVVGFAGLMGDLVESLAKRDVGVKDAPALLPGFGGLLDLVDSILLAGPIAFRMWYWLGFHAKVSLTQ